MPRKAVKKSSAPGTKVDKAQLRQMYTQMVRIREFEKAVKRAFIEHPGVIRGHAHLGDGAEASIVGALSTRRESDIVMPSYRCHGYPIVLGTPLRKIVAEVCGRRDGLCQRFGGSMHLADPSRHFPGTSGIIGQSIAHATGAALTAQVKKSGQIVYCFFGDGAAKQGAFFESLNMAAVWKLPIVYVLENNQYQAYTHFSLEDANAMAGDPLSKKADAFSIPGTTVDGTDPVAVLKAVGKAADLARVGRGPSLVETKFYRLSAHGNVITVPPLPTQFPEHEAIAVYGNKKEFEQWKSKDPVARFRMRLLKDRALTVASAKSIESGARAEVEDAVRFALASPAPALEEALKYVYA
jgi:pyruvate dehydrogenase E1 component alpha subunit